MTRILGSITGALMLVATVAGCASTAGVPVTPPNTVFSAGCYGTARGGRDVTYTGATDALNNAGYRATVGGACGGTATPITIVRSTSEAAALAKCLTLDASTQLVGNLLVLGYAVPSDVWGCAKPTNI
jgi:hypothetical protein